MTASTSAAAVSTIVSVPWVMTRWSSTLDRQCRTMTALSASVISRLSTIINVCMTTSTRDRPSRSISGTCVSLKNKRPVISSYCLWKVPPHTRMRIAMYAIVILRYRQPLEEVLKVQDTHRAYLRQLKADGVLLAAGPQEPRFGGMFLLRVPDDTAQAALDAVRDNDPFYQAGVAQYELIRWNVVIGKEDLDRL